MRTLYIRNVPDDVAERLERLAAEEGMSLNAFVVAELAESSRRADIARSSPTSPTSTPASRTPSR